MTQEQFDLFSRYLDARHDDGDMAQMSARDYLHLVIASPVKTSVVEFRDDRGKLVAACLLDRLDDGYSAVYSFFDPRENARSLGSYMILWMIEVADGAGGEDVAALGATTGAGGSTARSAVASSVPSTATMWVQRLSR